LPGSAGLAPGVQGYCVTFGFEPSGVYRCCGAELRSCGGLWPIGNNRSGSEDGQYDNENGYQAGSLLNDSIIIEGSIWFICELLP